jgi:hypothetical protein
MNVATFLNLFLLFRVVSLPTSSMYSTKVVNKNVTNMGYITINDQYTGKPRALPDRFKGKQLQTKPPLDTSGGVGFFSKKSYQSDGPIQDTTNYKKTQPQEGRKKAFGSNDASRRDEFSNTVSTEQYREALVRESKNRDNNLGDSIKELEMELDSNSKKVSKHLFDVGRKQVTEFNPKSHRDTFYNISSNKERNVGPYNLTSSSMGACASDPESVQKPEFGHVRKTKEFFDKSHLSM